MKRLGLKLFIFIIALFGATTALSESQHLKPALNLAETGEIKGVFEYCGPEGPAGVLAYIPGMPFMLKTGPSGMFFFHYVPAATYNITIEIPGQAPYILNNVKVTKRRVTDLGTVYFCPDNDGDGFSADYDCNDNNLNVYPGAQELCDALDNNCDGVVDEGCQTCTDSDGDGFFAQQGCGSSVDCNDTDQTVNPGVNEICGDGRDNNCSDGIDEGCASDNDGDGYSVIEDCDDQDRWINPGAPEQCDGIDNDCDGMTDEELVAPPCELTEGVCGGVWRECLGSAGWTGCDYGMLYQQSESGPQCDGVDNDCDGQTDEACAQ